MRKVLNLFILTTQIFRKKKVTLIASSLSYFTLFATAPIVIILLQVLGIFLSDDMTQKSIIQEVYLYMGPYIGSAIQTVIKNIMNQPVVTDTGSVISFAILLIAATTIIRLIQKSLHTIWGIDLQINENVMYRIHKRILATIFLLTLGLVVITSFSLTTLIVYVKEFYGINTSIVYILSTSVTFISVTCLFFLVYTYLPDTRINPKDVVYGALIAAIFFMIGKNLMTTYLARSSFMSLYGAAGSILAYMVWIYYSYIVFLYGAVFTYAYATTYGQGVLHISKHK